MGEFRGFITSRSFTPHSLARAARKSKSLTDFVRAMCSVHVHVHVHVRLSEYGIFMLSCLHHAVINCSISVQSSSNANCTKEPGEREAKILLWCPRACLYGIYTIEHFLKLMGSAGLVSSGEREYESSRDGEFRSSEFMSCLCHNTGGKRGDWNFPHKILA